MLNTLTLLGAYGRKYKTKEKALADWNNGKDFKIKQMGCYCSIRDSKQFLQEMYYIQIQTEEGYLDVGLI